VLNPVAEGKDITEEQMLQRLTQLNISLADLHIETAAHLVPLQAEESYS
jgi:hypothetical protein